MNVTLLSQGQKAEQTLETFVSVTSVYFSTHMLGI